MEEYFKLSIYSPGPGGLILETSKGEHVYLVCSHNYSN